MAELTMSQPGGRPTAEQVRDALVEGYRVVFASEPSIRVQEWMLAQCWFETRQGASLWLNNVGNITAGSSWKGDIWRPSWYDIDENSSARDVRLHKLMLQGKAPRAFRAYPTLYIGAQDYVARLRYDFPTLLEAMRESDSADTIARAIVKSNYCPDCSTVSTAKNLSTLREQLRQEGVFPLGQSGDRPTEPESLRSLDSLLYPLWQFQDEARLGTLREGFKGPLVALWQSLVGNCRVDGYFGPVTLAATKLWQSSRFSLFNPSRSLTIDGVVGPESWSAMIAELAARDV